jgi:hypothetical protein
MEAELVDFASHKIAPNRSAIEDKLLGSSEFWANGHASLFGTF